MRLPQTIRQIQRIVGVARDGIFGPLTAAATLRHLQQGEAPDIATGGEALDFDPRTERNLAGLDPAALPKIRSFVAKAKAVAASMGCEFIVISGHRSWRAQDALYAKGRTAPGRRVTNARGGSSNHNFGIAIDGGIFRAGKYLDTSDPALAGSVYRAIAVHAPTHGLEWGGNWRRFKDLPHFEIRTGLTMSQKRSRWQASKSVL